MALKQVKIAFFILTYLVVSLVALGQATYTGKSKGSDRNYDVVFQIYSNDSIAYCYADAGCIYVEHYGKLTRINDTLFKAVLVADFEQFCMRDAFPDVDSAKISIDGKEFILKHLKGVELVFSNGTTLKMEDYYKKEDKKFITIRIPRRLKRGKVWTYCTAIKFTHKKNFLTGKALTFEIYSFGSATVFSSSNRKIEELVVIKNNTLYFVDHDSQVGDFILKRSK